MTTVLITGAAAGIGKATARIFAAHGWRCILVDQSADRLDRLLGELPPCSFGHHISCKIDLNNDSEIHTLSKLDVIVDVVINNAGMSSPDNSSLVDQDWCALHSVMDLNLKAPAQVVEALEPGLTPNCRIIHVASGAGLRALPYRGLYSPSKAGLITLAEAQAREKPDRMVHTLCPGFVRTELVDGLIASGRLQTEDAIGKIPMAYMGAPEDIAWGLFFLSTLNSIRLSSPALVIDGGSSVYGGGKRLNRATNTPVPLNAPCDFEVIGESSFELDNTSTFPYDDTTSNYYKAVIDFRAEKADFSDLLQYIHQIARDFTENHKSPASLTIVLPFVSDDSSSIDRAFHAAAYMLISTLACELGPIGYRVNGVVFPDNVEVESLKSVLRYLSGPTARFISGQTLHFSEIK